MEKLLQLADCITTAQYADRLFARLEVILNGGREAEEAFAAAALEEMAPSHLRYATRLSALLEATKYAQILVYSPKIDEKTRQAARFIRKCAASARKYAHLSPSTASPALFSDVLNEISLILRLLEDERLPEERAKWQGIAQHLEPLYLQSAITLSLSTDRIDTDKYGHPVSTCIDESFYCLKSSLTRTPAGLEAYLRVINELLIGRIAGLLKTSEPGSSNASLVLLNNLYYCGVHLAELVDGDDTIVQKCTEILSDALNALYHKLNIIIPNLPADVLINQHLALHFPKANLLAPQLLEDLKLIHLQGLSKALMQSLLDGKPTSNNANLGILLHQRIQSDWQGSLAFEAKVQSVLQRVNQAIELLSAEDPPALLEELKSENSLVLRAGESMILLERIKSENNKSK